MEDIAVLGVRMDEIRAATQADQTIQWVKGYLQDHWPKKGAMETEDLPFYHQVDGLKWHDDLLWKEGRIVVPSICQGKILQEAHSGHPGIE